FLSVHPFPTRRSSDLFMLDTNAAIPKLVSGRTARAALRTVAKRPFRVVPYFDPGPWGGHWMEEVCDLPNDAPNHAWCFDCVPEEDRKSTRLNSSHQII